MCSDNTCGNKSRKLTRIIEQQELFWNVRNFVKEKHLNRETVIAKNVLNYQIENEYCSVSQMPGDMYVKKDYDAA